jgi:ubiquinone/menaquinone biosynthesis C-methylase UbiE
MKGLEADRQTRLHHMLKFVLKSNSFIPLSNPTNVLDCGCGIGIWSVDMGQEYKGCTSVGLDICPPTDIISPNFNKNVIYVTGDISEPLKFGDNTFDLINQRDMMLYIEPNRWVQTLTEYERILKPGGWVQLAERDMLFNCDHPAVQSLNSLFKRAMDVLGVDPFVCNKLDRLVEEAGFVNITRRVLEIPIGEWDEREGFAHIGFINRNYTKMALKCFKSYLVKVNNITGDKYDKICAGALGACERNKGYNTFVIVCGQKRTDG